MDQTRLNLPYTGVPTFLRGRLETDLERLGADIAVLGVPTDDGGPWKPGARFGPRAIREQSVRFAGYGTGLFDPETEHVWLEPEMRRGRIVDCGDVDIIYTNREQTFENITTAVRTILRQGAIPVVLGGDHGVSYPVVRAWDEPLVVIQFDAHLDFKEPTAEVGYSNGMPFYLISELPNVEKIIQVGIRSLRTRQTDLEMSRARGNIVQTPSQFRAEGIESILRHCSPSQPVYISIDIDALDLPLVPGCASAEPGGLTFEELRQSLLAIAGHAPVVGFDLVEVNPMLDVASGATSLLAAQLVVELMGKVVEHPHYAEWRAS